MIQSIVVNFFIRHASGDWIAPPKNLGKMLNERGLLLSRADETRYTARISAEGAQTWALHLDSEITMPIHWDRASFDHPDYDGPPLEELLDC